MDYHERKPRDEEPPAPFSPWGTGGRAPEPQPQPGRDQLERWAPPEPSRTPDRAPYAGRDHGSHGYRDDRPDTRPAPPPARTWAPVSPPSSHVYRADHTSSWRVNSSQPIAPPEPEPLGFDGEDRDYPAALWWTVIWYAVPFVIYTLWALLMSTSEMRGHALHALLTDAPGVLLALVISLALAAWIRRISLAWRAISLGFGAATVGAGIATLIFSAF